MSKAPSESPRDWSLLGANVRALRKSLGWTLDTLAERSKVSLTTLKRIESGQPCSFRTQERLAKAFSTALGSLWEPRLFSRERVSVFRPEDSRWRFPNSEEAANWALNEDKRQIDPDAIQNEDERLRLGRNGLAEGFARIFRRQFPTGYLGVVFYECYARQGIDFPPHVDAICLYGARGTLIVYLDEEPYALREGDVLVLDSSLKVELAPEQPVGPAELPPMSFSVFAQLGTEKRGREREAN